MCSTATNQGAIGLKFSDEFTVPFCRGYHQQLHHAGNEQAWWAARKMDALIIAKNLGHKRDQSLHRLVASSFES
jgi:hypothetical protein